MRPSHIAIIAITEHGLKTAQRIVANGNLFPSLYVTHKVADGTNVAGDGKVKEGIVFSEPLQQLVQRIFKQYDGLVFIMAMGIVVRMIASHLRDKHTDPAVVVVDDVGRFVVSMLSGHEGGANELAHRIAAILHTDAVITTGTEAQKDVIVGIGCKKGAAAGDIRKSILDALQKANLTIGQVRLLATVDVKSGEPGLLQASEELGIPLRVVSRPEIATCAKEYSPSAFVKDKIGVWAVSEPSALLAGRKTQLILAKQKYPGVTVAIARENFTW